MTDRIRCTVAVCAWAMTLFAALVPAASAQSPISTAISYTRGHLKMNGELLNGTYDVRFRLFDAASGGMNVGQEVNKPDIRIVNGELPNLVLDFGEGAFSGDSRWIEVRARQGSNGFVVVGSRQRLQAVPYALSMPGIESIRDAHGQYQMQINQRVGIGMEPGLLSTDPYLRVAGAIHSTRGLGLYMQSNDGFSISQGLAEYWLFAGGGKAMILSTHENPGLGAYRLVILPNGNIGIGTDAPAFQLHLTQNSAAKPTSNTWTISSDERLKKNIAPIEGALQDLLALRGVTYQWKDPASQGNMSGTYTGLIAQEVEQVFPEWVQQDAAGFKTLTVIGFEGVVVEAFRELRAEKDAEIQALQGANAALRSEVDDLKARLARLEAALAKSEMAQ